MNWLRVAAGLLLAALAGCASGPIAIPAPTGELLSGRLAVRVDGVAGADPRSMNAAFELQGDGRAGSLNLTTPLGTTLARARWSPGQVVLATAQGESRFADLDALTREALGESVPVVALFDWLRGRPWPGAPSARLTTEGEPGFQQLGWAVSLAKFDQDWIAATRAQAPSVTIRAKLDRP